MFDLEQIEKHLTNAVKKAVEAEAYRLQGGIAVNEMIVSILRKPFMTFPDDVQLVLKIGRTTAFELPKDPNFPPVTEVGRRRFIDTEAFMKFVGVVVKDAA